MRNNEKWREVIEEVVGSAMQKWRTDEIERADMIRKPRIDRNRIIQEK